MNDRKESSGFAAMCRKFLCVALMAIVSFAAAAQSKTVKGKVLDQQGEPMIGVTVMVKGSSTGTATDLDGAYSLSNVANNATLVFSYVGCQTQEVKVAGKSVIDVTLLEDSNLLDDLVVVGYGVVKKSDVTGAVTSVDSETLNTRPVSNALEALQGKAAGVDITTNERPGVMGDIRIRGNRSLSAGQSPLYVVDGVPLNSGGIEAINPRDIEKIDILKDASATAIYGSRGANGVVLVTTKGGRDGQFHLNYSGSVTTSNIVDKSEMMSPGEFVQLRRWAAYNVDPDTYAHPNSPTKENDLLLFDSPIDNQTSRDNIMRAWANGTWDPSLILTNDWTDLYTRTGISTEHTISASGGTEKMRSYASFGYLKNEGTQKGQSYTRYTGKVSTSINPTKWIQIDASINASYQNQDYGMNTTGARSNNVPDAIYDVAKGFYSWAPMYDADGVRVLKPGGEDTSYTILGELEQQNFNRKTFRALGNFAATIKFGAFTSVLDGLTYKIAFGPDYRHYRQGDFISGDSSYKVNGDGSTGSNWARLENQRAFSWTLDNLINYNRTFAEKHSVGLTLLQTASHYNYEWSNMTNQNMPKDSYLWNNIGAASITDAANKAGMGSGITNTALESYMIRVNYGFAERYLLTASGRWDGASQLAKGHKWDFFPSLALAWRIDQEEFMRAQWLSSLKLRLGVGTTGNAAVPAYRTKGSISQMFLPFLGTSTPAYSSTEDYYNIYNPLANEELGWEKTTQWNVGIDFGFLNSRINGSLEFYWSKTNDILMEMSIPQVTGYSSTWANIGKAKNHGVELSINAIPVISGGFQWETNLNAAYQTNSILELANGKEDDLNNKWFIGHEIGVMYDWTADGIWQNTPEDLAEMAKWNEKGENFTPGNVRPHDVNGDYVMDDEDKQIIGNTNPKWTLGWSNTFTWKGIELSFQIISRLGYKVNLGSEGLNARSNQRKVDYWTPDNPDAEFQKPLINVPSAGSKDKYCGLLGIHNGGFVKMRNISLGYNLPKSICEKATLQNLKVYVQCINPFDFYNSVKGFSLDTGRTYFNRSFVFGLDFGF